MADGLQKSEQKEEIEDYQDHHDRMHDPNYQSDNQQQYEESEHEGASQGLYQQSEGEQMSPNYNQNQYYEGNFTGNAHENIITKEDSRHMDEILSTVEPENKLRGAIAAANPAKHMATAKYSSGQVKYGFQEHDDNSYLSNFQ